MIVLDFVYYFDDEGCVILYGRSVGYRFVMIFFWGVLVYVDVEFFVFLIWGMVKGIVFCYLWWW